jgi:hypothetical protein
MAIEARRRNPETELGWSLPEPAWPETGRRAELLQREKQPKAFGESDHLIVLRDGRADHMGKGVTVLRIRQRPLAPDNVGLGIDEPTFLAETSMGYNVPSTRVSITEEPGVGKLHAGICAGGTG